MKKNIIIILLFLTFSVHLTLSVFCQEVPARNAGPVQAVEEAAPKTAGEFFGMPVPADNYYFVKSVIYVFGNKFGAHPKTAQEFEDAAWDNLLLSFEAFRRGIEVTREELEKEVTKIIESEKVTFDWLKDKDAYEKWLKDRVNENSQLFENQIKHLIQVQKLYDKVREEADPFVSDDETHRAFLNENSSLGLELIQFDKKEDALVFYDNAKKDPSFWDKEDKKRPKDFKRPGTVSLQFLIDFWKIPDEAMHKMVKMKKGDIYNPEPIYKGWGVFKILETGPADEAKYKEVKDKYFEKVKLGKKYEAQAEWFKKLKEMAKIKVYPMEDKENVVNETEMKKEGSR